MGRDTIIQTDPADAAAFKAAREMCRAWEDFTFAARFLDPAKRNAACAVVAFFGMIAEAIGANREDLTGAKGLRQHPAVVSPAGACCSSEESEALLETFRARLDQIFDSGLELPSPGSRSPQQHALHALARTAERFELRREHFLRFAEERARDATIARYPTWNKLEQHCRATGGSIAAAVGEVLGLQHSDAARGIERLGVGLRLVQLLRNVEADRQQDRIYVPLEDMARCRYSERDLLADVVNDQLDALWKHEADRAESTLAEGMAAIPWIAGERSRVFASVLVVLARATLKRPPTRPHLTTAMRLRQLPAAWRLARLSPTGTAAPTRTAPTSPETPPCRLP
jgi:phytoene/squalene synthetase